MSKKNLKKIFLRNLNTEQNAVFSLIRSTEKANKYIKTIDFVKYDELVAYFKGMLNDIQRDIFVELYNTTPKSYAPETSKIFLAGPEDFGNDFLHEELRDEIYTELTKFSLAIDYCKKNGERRTIYAAKIDVLDFPKSSKETDFHSLYITDEEDGQLKKLIMKRIIGISKA